MTQNQGLQETNIVPREPLWWVLASTSYNRRGQLHLGNMRSGTVHEKNADVAYTFARFVLDDLPDPGSFAGLGNQCVYLFCGRAAWMQCWCEHDHETDEHAKEIARRRHEFWSTVGEHIVYGIWKAFNVNDMSDMCANMESSLQSSVEHLGCLIIYWKGWGHEPAPDLCVRYVTFWPTCLSPRILEHAGLKKYAMISAAIVSFIQLLATAVQCSGKGSTGSTPRSRSCQTEASWGCLRNASEMRFVFGYVWRRGRTCWIALRKLRVQRLLSILGCNTRFDSNKKSNDSLDSAFCVDLFF